MEEKQIKTLIQIFDSLTAAKLILVDVKVGNLMTFISDSDECYEIVLNAMTGFDYKAEYEKATAGTSFKLPADLKKLVALVFCMLCEIENKKFNLYAFLGKFFTAETLNESFAQFANTVLVQFKNAMLVLLGYEEEKSQLKTLVTEEPKQQQKPTLEEMLKAACQEIGEFAVTQRGCYNTGLIIDAMIHAIEKGNLTLFDAHKEGLIASARSRKLKKFIIRVFAEIYSE